MATFPGNITGPLTGLAILGVVDRAAKGMAGNSPRKRKPAKRKAAPKRKPAKPKARKRVYRKTAKKKSVTRRK